MASSSSNPDVGPEEIGGGRATARPDDQRLQDGDGAVDLAARRLRELEQRLSHGNVLPDQAEDLEPEPIEVAPVTIDSIQELWTATAPPLTSLIESIAAASPMPQPPADVTDASPSTEGTDSAIFAEAEAEAVGLQAAVPSERPTALAERVAQAAIAAEPTPLMPLLLPLPVERTGPPPLPLAVPTPAVSRETNGLTEKREQRVSAALPAPAHAVTPGPPEILAGPGPDPSLANAPAKVPEGRRIRPLSEVRLADLISRQQSVIDSLADPTPAEQRSHHEPMLSPPMRSEPLPTPSAPAFEMRALASARPVELSRAAPPPIPGRGTPQPAHAAAAPSTTLGERAPMIIERARAEMTARSDGTYAGKPSLESGAPGFLAGLALSIAIAGAVYLWM